MSQHREKCGHILDEVDFCEFLNKNPNDEELFLLLGVCPDCYFEIKEKFEKLFHTSLADGDCPNWDHCFTLACECARDDH